MFVKPFFAALYIALLSHCCGGSVYIYGRKCERFVEGHVCYFLFMNVSNFNKEKIPLHTSERFANDDAIILYL